ncbi:MAG: hypothetical protein L0Z50_11800 [Verrucomicrobiales bacterium]|nr:hypothetical protein [Verrucomicrobiales bacterium]
MNFEIDYLPKLGRRARGFGRMFELLGERRRETGPLIIVETGCLRSLNWEGDGCSTILFHEFAVETRSRLVSIDINPAHCMLARGHCPQAEVLCGDAVQVLYQLRSKVEKIDLLYLDSYDVDWNDPHPSALHHFKELCAASPMLRCGSLVFVDDHVPDNGKPLYVREYMLGIGAEIVHEDYQIGFVMP